jgi:hypothetical protein
MLLRDGYARRPSLSSGMPKIAGSQLSPKRPSEDFAAPSAHFQAKRVAVWYKRGTSPERPPQSRR